MELNGGITPANGHGGPAPLHVLGQVLPAWPIATERVARAKRAYTTRNVPLDGPLTLLFGDELEPEPGDLVLARVLEVGHHRRLELGDGRRAHLFPGDEVLVCYGDRYAPDQFEAEIPRHLLPCDLVAAGGVAAECLTRSADVGEPTRIEPIGLLADGDGRRINIASTALVPAPRGLVPPPTFAAVGTGMNAGKSTMAASLVRGLVAAGLRVGAAKVTGTGAGPDVWLLKDAGADPVLDFTDAGYVSTYRVPPIELEGVVELLTGRLTAAEVDCIVLEVADGIYQPETAELVASPAFVAAVDGVLFAARDALGAAAGADWLTRAGLPVMAVGGRLTASSLAMRETAFATGLPVLGTEDLADPDRAGELTVLDGPPGSVR